MASRVLVVFENGQYRARTSTAETIDFLSVKVGASALEIKETTAQFDFTAHKLTNIADGTAAAHAASYGQSVLRDGTNAMSANLNLNSNKIINLSDPTAAQDAATKSYVDLIQQGIKWKNSVRAISTSNITLSGTQTVDGVALIALDRILVAGQTTAANNGIYVVAAGAWSRSTDADANSEISQLAVFVQEGTSFADTGWVCTTDGAITLGTTSLAFVQFTGTGSIVAGAGLTKTGATIDFNAGDDSLTVNADNAIVKRDAAGAIGLTTGQGIKVITEASNPSLQIASNELGIKFDAAGALSKGSAGTKANVDGTTLEISSNAIRIKDLGVSTAKIADAAVTEAKLAASVAGNGLSGGAGSPLAVNTGDMIQIASDAVAADFTRSYTNDNAGSVTVRQVVYVKANGNMDLARADVASLSDFELGFVADASIATTVSGKITIRHGAVIGGFSGLTPGKRQYVHATTAGSVTETAPSASGQFVYLVGRAVSATEIKYEPEFIIEIV